MSHKTKPNPLLPRAGFHTLFNLEAVSIRHFNEQRQSVRQ